jgi:hypothetical protein
MTKRVEVLAIRRLDSGWCRNQTREDLRLDKSEPTYSFGDDESRKVVHAQLCEGGHRADGSHDVFEHRGYLFRHTKFIGTIGTPN